LQIDAYRENGGRGHAEADEGEWRKANGQDKMNGGMAKERPKAVRVIMSPRGEWPNLA
jgi:hypothetical protein